jgi:polar amino acid transport system substrate-binding protein
MASWMHSVLWTLSLATLLPAQSLNIYCEEAPPNQFLGPDGQLTGMCVELVREIQWRVGNADPIQVVPWARGYEEVRSKPNTVLFTMARTAQRNDSFQWVGPILEMSFSFYVRSDSPVKITNLEDAKQLTGIGVYTNDVRDQVLTQAGFTNLERTNNNIQNFKKLMSGRLDAYAGSSISIDGESKDAGYKASDVKSTYTFLKVQLYIAMSKGTPKGVVQAWTSALEGMRKDRTFMKIHRKYYPTAPLPGKAITDF